MNGTKRREALSSGCAVKCMLDAYSNEGHALAIRMSPKLGFSEWFASSDLDAILKGDYELKVKGWEVVYNLGKKDQHSAKSHAAADNKKPQDLEGKILRFREFSSSELLEGLLNKMSPSAETRRSNYPQLKAAMLERKLDLASALSDSDHLHERYETEYASNGQSRRLLKIAGEMKEAYVEIEKAHMAIFEAEEKMEAAEQNLLQ
ncbi:hypothetical protein BFJ63_vAg3366 [Fusarium oxysporum f. sp. narcissi]|uniref:Uncharacterized protein n=3 Tax=Fusarium oxysporum TaxID=5507 RepID=A0A4Q2W5W4_FUSOX|nr:hypothetical protein FOZG_15856 [Fusarium oxysporum Fo47]RKK07010.1 hypothetical protein BFJ65_g18178 [Fusarium oxysporum f. sp. cepae]RKK34743.1 hypothetical protein BFJ67_g13636 [Fusarium oxysporum f. sp. cepae]RKK38493.1 hypothetical protein BFJ66_g12434 [Fusarium oxysporum f. sp. cepae]RYC93728.1 hypothetical protein BFJ63_vAg3366 [Fusarium oxysporum f. sp. narcissi]